MNYKPILIILLIIGAAFFGIQQLATTGFSGTPVNIAFGDTPETNPDGIAGKYYVGSALVDGNSLKYVFVPEGMTYEDALALQFTARNSVWKTSVLNPSANVYYSTVYKSWLGTYESTTEPVPYKTVDMVNPVISVSADVKLGMPDGSVKSGSVGNTDDYTQRFTVKDSAGIDRTIHIRYNELSFKRGDLPPSGDLDVLEDTISGYRLITHDNLVDGTGPIETSILRCTNPDSWNCYFKDKVMWGKYSYIDEYSDYYNWMVSNNKIPDKKPNAAISYNVANNDLSINYPSTVFTQSVTFYIPEELAEFIMVVEQVPQFIFDPVNSINTNEGELTRVEVSGTAIGSGTINLYVDGLGEESYSWTGGSEKQIVKGKSYTFEMYVKSSQVNTDSSLPITIYSQPSGMGVATQVTFYNNIKDTAGVPSYDLTIKCIDSNGKTVTNAEIYVDNDFVGYGSTTKSVVKGNHYVYAKNVTGWYSGYPPDSPKFVSVNEDKTVEIPFTTEPPKEDFEYNEILLIGFIAIIAIVLLSLIANELGASITTNQIIVMVVLVGVAIVGYVMLSITYEMFDRIVSAIEDFKLV